MAENSLGRAVAVTALAPIAERLADQRERDEREERERAEAGRALPTATDPSEIIRLFAVTDPGTEWSEAHWSGWKILARSGALKTAEMELVRVRFRHQFFGRQAVTELWRRPAWRGDYEDDRWWLDAEASLWNEATQKVYVDGAEQQKPATSVSESYSEPSARVKDAKFFEKTFLVEASHPVQMSYQVRPHSTFAAGGRYWSLDGGIVVEDFGNFPRVHRDYLGVMIHIALDSLPE